eukprot:353445-Chlamydomonas_euryale.AAC.26
MDVLPARVTGSSRLLARHAHALLERGDNTQELFLRMQHTGHMSSTGPAARHIHITFQLYCCMHRSCHVFYKCTAIASDSGVWVLPHQCHRGSGGTGRTSHT